MSLYDIRFINSRLRKKIYKAIGEDPNMSYYDLALKHGYDTARFFNTDTQKPLQKENTHLDHIPERWLNGFHWTFMGGKLDKAGFEKECDEAGDEIPNASLPVSKIGIICEYLDEEDVDHCFEQVLESKEDRFPAGDFMLQMHNALVDALEDNDFHFFEGLTLAETKDGVPYYFVDLGS